MRGPENLQSEFRDVYEQAGRTRARIRGFIKYLLAYEKKPKIARPNKVRNPEPGNGECE